jgi:hypothetical protein
MKKGLLALAVFTILGFASTDLLAWGGGPGWCYGPGGYGYGSGYNRGYGSGYNGFRGYGHLEFLKERIGLSDAQIQKIIRIDADFRAKYFENRNDYDKLNALRIEHRKAVEGVLTDAQRKKLDDYYRNWQGPGYLGNYGYCPWGYGNSYGYGY